MGTASSTDFSSFQERRLKTTKLYHKTQQRGNNLFAREYQHVTQCRHQKRDVALPGTLRDLSDSLAHGETIA
jgi:hypothetical protein